MAQKRETSLMSMSQPARRPTSLWLSLSTAVASSRATKSGARKYDIEAANGPSKTRRKLLIRIVKVYANVGYYFAQQGIISVVANHQLVPHVKYPGGADDMRLVREWIYENITAPKYGQGSVQKVFLFGHSSGGAHVCMDLFAEGKPQYLTRYLSLIGVESNVIPQETQTGHRKILSSHRLLVSSFSMSLFGLTRTSQLEQGISDTTGVRKMKTYGE